MNQLPHDVARKISVVVMLGVLACLLPACVADSNARASTQTRSESTQGSGHARGDEATSPAAVDPELSHGYSALHAMADKNRQLDKLLWVKSVTSPTEALVKRVSKVSAEAAETISDIAKTSDTIELGEDGVPAIDATARDGIESATRKTLIMGNGESFEVQLILSQIRAMQWGAQMADALAEQDPDQAHQKRMRALGEQFAQLRDALTARLALAD